MKRKLLSLILSIIMVFSLVPASAFAAVTEPADGYDLVWSEDFDEEYSSDDFSENEEIGLNATTAMPDGWSSDESDNNNAYVVRTEDGNNALFLNGKTAKATIVDSSKFDTYLGQEYYLTYDYWTVEGKSPKVACTLFGGGNDSGLVSLASPTTNVQNKTVICAFREGETVKIRFSLQETGSNDDVVFIDNIALWKPAGQETATKYDLWVGGTRVTSQNAGNILASNYTNNGKISFDAESNTLTLNGADLYEDLYYSTGDTRYSVYGKLDELNIEVAGNSKLGPDTNFHNLNYGDYCGIYNSGTLNIKGNKILTINMGYGREGDVRGVYGEGGITVNGDVTVKVSGEQSNEGDYNGFYSPRTVEFTGDSRSEVDFSTVSNYVSGVAASKVIVSENADVNIKSMNNGIAYADGSSTSFKQTGGRVTIDADNEGIYMDAFEMGGGTLNVTSSKTALHTIDTLKFSGGTTELFGAEKAINHGAAEFDFSVIKYYNLYAGDSSSSAAVLTEVPTGAAGIGAYKYYKVEKTTPPLENYDLWVGATQVTSENKDDILPENPGSVKYDPETKTLTLNNATVIGGAERTYNEGKSFAGIYSEIDELTIKLEGTSGNRVSVDNSATVSQDYAFAIQSTGKVKFAGSGQIFVEIPQVNFASVGGANVGMTAEEGITIGENAIVCVNTEEANPGENVGYVIGIMSNGACVVGENSQLVLTTCADEQYREGKNFLASMTVGFEVKDNADVSVSSDLFGIQSDVNSYVQTGGTVNINSKYVGLYAESLKMSGGSLTTSGDQYGIFMSVGQKAFAEISGGTIEATGGTQAINPNNALPDVSNFAGMKVLAGASKAKAAAIASLPATTEGYTYKYMKIYSGAEEPEVKYDLWVGGKQVTNKNAADILDDGKVSFNANTNTLTLNGAIITEKAQVGFASTWPWASIHSWLPELKIKLKGESTIGAPSDDELNKKYIGYRGIYAKGKLTFEGDGTLNVNMAPEWTYVYGIEAEGLMTIGDNVTIKTVHTATAGTSHETIYAEGGLTICDNAVVDFTLKKGNGYYAGLEGISASGTITVSDNAKVKIESDGRCFYQTSTGGEANYVQRGGEVNLKSYNHCFYINDFSFIDGKLTAESTRWNVIDLFGSNISFMGGRAELTGKPAVDVYEDSVNTTFNGVVVKAGESKNSAAIINYPSTKNELCAHNYYLIEKGDATVGYNLWVGSTQVTTANLNNVLGDGKVSFDPDTNTLTLKDAKIASYHKKLLSAPGAEEVYGGFQIYSGFMDLTIELKGTNEITGRSLAGNFFDRYFGIYSKQDITFKGDGTLSLTYPTVFEYAVGLSSENGDLTFEGSPNVILSINENMGSVNDLISIFGNNITFKDDVSVEIITRLNEASVDHKVENAAVLPVNKVEISGNAKLIAESSQYGIYCPGSGEEHKYVQTGGNVQIAAKEQAVYTYDFTQEGGYLLASSANTNAIFANSVKITDGSGELYSPTATIKTSNGPDFSGYERLKLMGGEDKATAQEVKDYSDTFEYFSYGNKDTALKLYDIWVSGIQVTSDNAEDVLGDGKVKFDAATNTLTLNGATISNGSEDISSDDGNICIGIYSALENLNVVLEGENIIAYGGSKDFDTYYGIVTSGNIKFSGNGTLNIKALETDRKGVGIYSTGKVTVTDSAVLKFTGPDSMSNDWKYKGVLADNVEISGKAKIDINVKQPQGLTVNTDLTGIEFKENFEISGTSEIKIDIDGVGIASDNNSTTSNLIVKGGKLDISGKNIGVIVKNFEQTGGTINIHDSDRGAWFGGIFKITGGTFEAEGMLHAMLAGPENIDLSGYKNIKILLGKTKAAAEEVTKLPTTVSDLGTYGYLKIYEGKNSGGGGGGGNGGGGGISVPANSTETKPENMEKKLPFKDVFETDSYYDAVYSLWDKGLISGITNELFGPNVEISRGMIVAILWRAEGSPTAVGENIFTDVLPGSYYEKAAIWATSKGIISGYGDGTFGPNDIITTEQMVTILYYYAKYKGMDLSVGENTNILSYDDVIQMGEYAFTPMQWACGAGVYDGKDAKLMPKVKLTRAEVTEMLYRVTK